MSIEIKTVADRIFEEVWNQRNREAVDELITADYVHHDGHGIPVEPGIEGYKQFVSIYLNAFSDLRFTIEDEISADDKIVTRWRVAGTHDGDLPGLPRTGKSISLAGISITRLRDGKIAESWNNWDMLGMMQQLGAIPAEARQQAA
jgi:steroid delta-isomerase-like uncharacterized protein